jgi:hypothetical protein
MNPDKKNIITGGGAVAGALTGLVVGNVRKSEDTRAYVMFGGLAGAWIANIACVVLDRQNRLIGSISELIYEEGQRQGKAVDKSHVQTALKRFNKEQLDLFDQYVRAFIARDIPKLKVLLPKWKAMMQPVVSSSPEWLRYEGIIFGT